ncbi:hypothetical protein [Chlamydiifrater phoenicopteri]|uniref:hypothetical protein n=1 Tax=Chlamydiifrater phoenicopteri TaxID=2681469 RepID=UPI001BCE8145|nr:hypothetical protein [Chlamydiifrater phoenicopteri]
MLADTNSSKPLKGKAKVLNKRLAEAVFIKSNKKTTTEKTANRSPTKSSQGKQKEQQNFPD